MSGLTFVFVVSLVAIAAGYALHHSEPAREWFAERIAGLHWAVLPLVYLTTSAMCAHVVTVFAMGAWSIATLVFFAVYFALRWKHHG